MAINFSDKNALKNLSAEINAALAAVAAKHGISIKPGGCVYGENSATVKVDCSNLGASGEVLTKHRLSFLDARIRRSAGLVESDLGATFTHNGIQYQLDGLQPTKSRPIVATKKIPDGKFYTFGLEVLTEIVAARQTKS